jgi:multiple sugar transport system ATP-binding protein
MEVRLHNLSKVFVGRKKEQTVAVSKMSITIPSGKLLGLLGPSGCGKSTTLYMIAGLHKATEGRIWFGKDNMNNVPPENRGIGLVFQNYALYPHFTVRQNIMFPLENVRPKLPKKKMEAIAEAMAKLVDIQPYLNRKPKQLSGGQQQRVAIARALAKRPRVLLLDEPLSNLDARLRLQTREEIKRIQRDTGITTIFVTHDQEEAMSISDIMIVMDKGVVQQVDEPQHIYDEPINLFVAMFLGVPAINVFDAEIKGDKLLLNGKPFDEGYKGIGPFVLLSHPVFDIAVKGGYTGSFDEFRAITKHLPEEKPHASNKKDVTEEKQKEDKEVVDVPLDAKDVFVAISKHGYKGDPSEFAEKVKVAEKEWKNGRPVKLGIRPEAFTTEKTKTVAINVAVEFIEHIGRDISVIGKATGPNNKIRIIIPSETRDVVVDKKSVDFYAKRFYVFETSGERIK